MNLSWELDLWGRIRSDHQAAIADFQVQQADFNGAKLSLIGQVAKTWFAVAEAGQQAALAEQTVKNYRETAKQAIDRVEAGVQSPVDRHLAMSNVVAAEGLLELHNESLARSIRQLELLLGRYPSGNLDPSQTLPSVAPSIPAGLPVELLRRRPDLVAAERRLAGADQRITSAKAALYPRLSLTSSGGILSPELDGLLAGNSLIWSIAGNLVQPVFEGGRLRARVEMEESRFRELLADFASRVLNAFTEVETALEVERILSSRKQKLRLAADEANAAIQVAQNRYAQGVETLIIVLEGQRRYLESESTFLTVKRQCLDARIDLHLALGGGFDWSPIDQQSSDRKSEDIK